MAAQELLNLSTDELRKQVRKYRLITLLPLGLGLAAALLLIWVDSERRNWELLYLLLMTAMLPLLLKSGRLHREWRRRCSDDAMNRDRR